MIFAIFWRRAPLQNTAAGKSSANSCIRPNIKERPEEGQVHQQAATKDQLTCAHPISLQTLIMVFPLFLLRHPFQQLAIFPITYPIGFR